MKVIQGLTTALVFALLMSCNASNLNRGGEITSGSGGGLGAGGGFVSGAGGAGTGGGLPGCLSSAQCTPGFTWWHEPHIAKATGRAGPSAAVASGEASSALGFPTALSLAASPPPPHDTLARARGIRARKVDLRMVRVSL